MRGGATRAFWILTAMAVVFLILFLVVSATMWNRMAAIDREAQDARDKLQALKTAVQGEDIAELERHDAQLEERLSHLERDLPQPAYVPTLLRQLEREALLTHNDVTEVRPGELRRGRIVGAPEAEATPTATGTEGGTEEAAPAATGQRYDELDIVLRLRGSYHSTFEFLKRIGSLRKMLYLQNLTVQRAGMEMRPDNRAEIDVELQLVAYILEPRAGFPGRLVPEVFD